MANENKDQLNRLKGLTDALGNENLKNKLSPEGFLKTAQRLFEKIKDTLNEEGLKKLPENVSDTDKARIDLITEEVKNLQITAEEEIQEIKNKIKELLELRKKIESESQTSEPIEPEKEELNEANSTEIKNADTELPDSKKESRAMLNIFNQIAFRIKFKNDGKEAEESNRMAEKQARFTKKDEVEKMIIGEETTNQVEKDKLFDLIYNNETEEENSQEILLGTININETKKTEELQKLIEKIALETGLGESKIREIIANQETYLEENALREVGKNKTKCIKAAEILLSISAPIAMGIGLGAFTGGVGTLGFFGGAIGTRLLFRTYGNYLNKEEAKIKVEEIRNNEELKNGLLEKFYLEIAANQKIRIADKINKKIFEDFINENDINLLEEYKNNEEEKKEVINALGKIAEIIEISNKSQENIFERFNGWIREKSIVKLLQNKTKSNNLEGATTIIFYGLLASTIREFPPVRQVLTTLIGGKLGYHFGKWLSNIKEIPEVDDQDLANDILDKLKIATDNEKHNERRKWKLYLSTATGAVMGYFVGEQLNELLYGQATENTEATTAVVESAETPVSPVPEQPGAPTSKGIVKGYANPDSYVPKPQVADIDASAGSVAIESAPPAEIGTGTELDNLIGQNKPLMEQIDGKNSNHLWGLIKAKTEVMVKGAEKIEGLKDLASSEERMTYIIDAIKDRVAENPTEFGLKAGANIDSLTSADLQTIAKDEDFNGLIADIFKADHPVDKALDLSEKALANIKGNNDYFKEVASKLSEGTKLDQQAYDVMGALRENGIVPDQAVGIIEKLSQPETIEVISDTTKALSDAAIAATETAGQVVDSVDMETFDYSDSSGLSGDASDIAATEQELTETQGLETVGKEYKSPDTKKAWQDIWRSFRNKDRDLRTYAFNKIFNETGISNAYTDETSKLEVLTSGHKGSNILEFTIPSPTESGAAEGNNIQFTIDKSKNIVTAMMGDRKEKLDKIINLDKDIRELFRTLTGK